jgi:hypothetical protein
MRLKLLVILIAAVLIGGTIQVYAHHSFSSTYFDDKTVKIEGKLVSFQLRNPHSFVQVDAPDEAGTMQRWAVEWGAAGQLGGQGISRDTLRPGDQVIITGNPGRNPADHRIKMLTLRRPSDGFQWGNQKGQVVQ